jgi:hypothetical protein
MQSVTVQKLQTLEQKVEYCLARYTDATNSDIDLFARVCENFYPPFETALYNWRDLAGAMHQVPSLDHIARCRRKVIRKHNYRKYLPTNRDIAIHRGLNEQIWIDYAKDNHIPTSRPNHSNIPINFDADGNHL